MPATEPPTGRQVPGARERLANALPLVALYAVACVVYVLLGRDQPVPVIRPDEFTYGGLARSIADGDGMTVLGDPVSARAALYLYLIAPAWAGASTVTAYATAKVIGAVLACVVVVPVWLVVRPRAGGVAALLAAALAVAGTWMTITSRLLLENAAYPLTTASLCCLVAALSRPGSRWGWVALAFAALAAWSRLQLVVLVPIITIAALADSARFGHAWRDRLKEHRTLAAVSGGLTVAGVLLVLIARSTALGNYSYITDTGSVHELVNAVAWQSIGLVVMTGFLPLFALLAISWQRDAWRDDALGPMLAVAWTAIVVFVLQSGWAVAGFPGLTWHIQRYEMYALPLLFAAVVVGLWRGFGSWRALAAAAALIAVALLFAPDVSNVGEQLAQFATERRVHALLGTSTGVSLTLAALVLGAIGAAALHAAHGRGDSRLAVAVVLATTFAVLLVQDQRMWSWTTYQANALRSQYPHDMQWVDHQSDQPAGVLVGTGNTNYSDVTRLFNRSIKAQFVPPELAGTALAQGHGCTWAADPTGVLSFDGGCPENLRRFYFEDQFVKFTLYDQKVVADRPGFARVVTVPPATQPRLKATLTGLCTPVVRIFSAVTGDARETPPYRSCLGTAVSGQFWLDTPAILELRFKGGTRPKQILVGKSVRNIPPGVTSVFRVPIPAATPAGPAQAVFPISWRGGQPPSVPDLVGARLIQDGRSTSILY